MTNRVRTRYYGLAGDVGQALNKLELITLPVTTNRTFNANCKDTCTDYTGPLGNGQALSIDHATVSGAWVSSAYREMSTKSYQSTNNFPLSYFNSVPSISHLPVLGRPPNAMLAVDLISRTNPSRPVVDISADFLELRDLPKIIYLAGKKVLQVAAEANLEYQFSLRPIMGDLWKLGHIASTVEARKRELKHLHENGGLRRKIPLFKDTAALVTGSEVTTNSSPSFLTVKHVPRTVTTDTVWGFVRWLPDYSLLPKTEWSTKEFHDRVFRATYNSELTWATVWEVLPWSWLIDYFGNVGDWLIANRNSIPCTHSTPLIMETLDTTIEWQITSNPTAGWRGAPYGNVSTRLVSKSRTPVSASMPSAQLPFFNKRQLSILASFAVLKDVRR